MSDVFPDDADGSALRRVLSDGSDLSKPMYIDFHVLMVDESSAQSMADAARRLGYHTSVYGDDDGSWTCECSTRMLASYEGVIAIQEELAAIADSLRGQCDGWGTFGNGPTGQPDYG